MLKVNATLTLAFAAMTVSCISAWGVELTKDGKPRASIVLTQSSSILEFAAAELRGYVAKISGATLPLERTMPVHLKGCIVLATRSETLALAGLPPLPSEPEAFVIQCDGENLFILGSNDRAVLYGVYAFLEHFGCRWFYPLPEEEVIPHLPTIRVAKLILAEKPQMSVRGLYLVPITANEVQRVANYIDWMGKRRLNMVLMHPDSYDSEADTIRWPEVSVRILPEIKKRGILLNMDIHSTFYFLPPKKHFTVHADWFGLVNGRRQPMQICYSNPQVVQAYAESVAGYAHAHPEVDVIGCWPMDDYGYCECEGCKQPDAILKAVNQVARHVKQVRPDVLVEHIAYGGNTTTPPKTPLDPNVLVLFCGRNPIVKQWIEAAKCAGSAGVYGLDYAWAENYGYEGRTRLRPHDVAQTVKAAKRDGLLGIAPLFIETDNWWRSGFNVYMFSRLAWNPDADLNGILADYYHSYYGEVSAPMKTYFDVWWDQIVDPDQVYGTITAEQNAQNQLAFSEARTALDKAVRAASTAALKAKVTRARVYLDFNEKWLTAQHQRWQLSQAAENRDKTRGIAVAAAIESLEQQMVEMCRRSHAAGDGVLNLRFFIARRRQRLEEDKYLIALAQGTGVVRRKSGVVYLSDLTPQQAQQDYGKLMLDRDFEGVRMALGQKPPAFYEKGLGTRANSTIVYHLDRQYERFRSQVGVQAAGTHGGSIVFQVFVDGGKAYDSGMTHHFDEPKTIDISVAGARELKLVVAGADYDIDHDLTNWAHHDWGDWADAHLVRSGRF
jgi:hypothetical protein